MLQSVLGSLALGYRPLWGRARTLCGVELRLQETDPSAAVDVRHLLRTLKEIWAPHSPPLLLAPQSRQLLCDLLEQAPPGTPWVQVQGDWLSDSTVFQRVQSAHQRGIQLVWRGDAGQLPDAAVIRLFDNSLLTLQPEAAVLALQGGAGSSQALVGQMYEGILSRTLVEHCLDQQKAHAVIDWPVEDVLHSMRFQPLQPSHAVVHRLMKAIDAEQSLEALEDILSEDPLLAYRFMTYTNSAGLGLRSGVDSLRRGLAMMGYGSLMGWLLTQAPHTSTEPNLHPVRIAMVLRAKLAEQLIEAGVAMELRREVYLCGLFSRMDELLGEPLGTILHRIPLSERIYDAAVLRSGPYASSLLMACALETGDASVVCQLCEDHELELEEVNRTLLRVLAGLEVAQAP